MAYINIPAFNNNEIKFCLKFKDRDNDNDNSDIFISESLYIYLTTIKQKINSYNKHWDFYKKITNPYEYIHTILPGLKFSICKYKPLSRSFFKMIEIVNTFYFLNEKSSINCFHLAEGPGGFIEAFIHKRNNNNDKYYGMTLISNDVNIPSWKKSIHFINKYKNIILEYGASNTGNLFLYDNLIYCKNKYENSMEYITADGGFDFSIDFDKQEELSYKLILCQTLYAIIMQKQGGNFILKIFDIFKYKTIEILFLLSNIYEYIYIYKPYTSRIANSEKYIICKNYKKVIPNINDNILKNFNDIMNNTDNLISIFDFKIPKLFLNKIEEINSVYGQQQIENISYTINIIREYLNYKNNFENMNLKFSEYKKSIIINLNNISKNSNYKNNDDELYDEIDDELDDELDNIQIDANKINDTIYNYEKDIKYNDINNDINNDKYVDLNYKNINNSNNIIILNKLLDLSPISTPSCSPKDDIFNIDKTLNLLDENIKITVNINKNINQNEIENETENETETENIKNNNLLNINLFNTLVSSESDPDTDDNLKIKNIEYNFDKFNNKINSLQNINIQKSINWCNKYKLPINKII